MNEPLKRFGLHIQRQPNRKNHAEKFMIAVNSHESFMKFIDYLGSKLERGLVSLSTSPHSTLPQLDKTKIMVCFKSATFTGVTVVMREKVVVSIVTI